MKKRIDPFMQWHDLQKYTECIQSTVDMWRSFFHTFQLERFSFDQIVKLLDQIDVTNTVLRNGYAYDMLRNLSINPVASGFPLRYDIRMTEADYVELKLQRRGIDVSSHDLKNALINTVFSQKVVNLPLLEKVSKTMSQEKLVQSEPLRLFCVRSITEVASDNGHKAYTCVWERFNYNNVPSLYTMLFEYHSDDDFTQDIAQELADVVRAETSQMPKLERLGRHIDKAMACVYPKWIGRLTFGPVFISHLTQDDIHLQHVLNDVTDEGAYKAASRIIYEYVVSKGANDIKVLRDPQGRKFSKLQEFAVRTTDEECNARGVTHLEKFLFAPHQVVQMLDADYRKEIGHQIVGG